HIGSWSWDVTHNVVLWSDELYRIFGLNKEEFTPSYDAFLERIHPDDRSEVHRKITHARTNHLSFEFDHRIVRTDGVVRTMHTRGAILVTVVDSSEKIIGTGQDITERVQSELKFRELIESAPDALVIVDRQGLITIVNSQTEKLFGYNREELYGKMVELLLPESYRKQHVLDRAEFFKDPQARPMGRGLDLYAKRKDGKKFPVEVSLSPITTAEGLVVSASIRDITERKIVERQITMLGHTINSMNECVTITDLNNVILSVNPAMLKTYGYEEYEVLGNNIEMLRGKDSSERLSNEIITKTFEEGWHGELINRKKNGEEFSVFLSTSVVRDQNGTPIALVGIARDITEQKKIQSQLEHIARQRAEDLRYFSVSVQRAQEEERRRIARELHDGLSQRLSGIKLHLELLSGEAPAKNKKLQERIKKIKGQITEMIGETHRISVNLHPSALDDFGLTVALQLLFKEFETTFKIPIAYHPAISTHERFDRYIEIALYRITQEALNNIAKHSKATLITIEFTLDTRGFLLTIEDNGIGIDQKTRDVKTQTKRGLGLISMKERTENVGGTFEIISEAGHGTKLLINIPAKQ
ncbi:MAG: PAS domain S-box protein, partial [Bacteroidetes bacterium]